MSHRELDRAQVLRALDEGHLKQRQASERLGVSVRQVQRLLTAYRRAGAAALVSKKRGQPSHHQLDPVIKQQALAWLETRYRDFGPTLAHEKLIEVHRLELARETVRTLMIQAGLWQPHRRRRPVVHPLRERRARLGELVQIDGSPFDWLEGRAPACTLLVYIDDATGRLMELFFTPAETTFSYFEATEHYLRRYGRPLAFYSDKLGVFRINLPNDQSAQGLTQFGRALQDLDIELICANSPQAKGRVEHANGVLQDRLVKEMRLRGISSMAAANAYLPAFIADFNVRFATAPRHPQNAHRPLRRQDDLGRILTVQETRSISKNLTLQYQRVIYQIQTKRPSYALWHATVLVRENAAGQVTIEYKGKPLAYTVHHAQARQAEVVPSKQLDLKLDGWATARAVQSKRSVYLPPADHPWRRFRIKPDRSKTQAPGDISIRQK
jgi:transposase